MKFYQITLVCLILHGCAFGISSKQINDNSNIITEFLVKEVLNYSLEDIMKKSTPFFNKKYKTIFYSYLVESQNNILIKESSKQFARIFLNRCNPRLKVASGEGQYNIPIVAVFHIVNDEKQNQKIINIDLGVNLYREKNGQCFIEKHEISNSNRIWTFSDDLRDNSRELFWTPSINTIELISLLNKKGLTTGFGNNHIGGKTYTSGRSIDGIRNYNAPENLKFSLKYTIWLKTYAKSLSYFGIQELYIFKSDENIKLLELYNIRMKDPQYIQFIRGYADSILNESNRVANARKFRYEQKQAEVRNYHKKIAEKFDRMHGDSGNSTKSNFNSPYQLNKQDRQFMKAMNNVPKYKKKITFVGGNSKKYKTAPVEKSQVSRPIVKKNFSQAYNNVPAKPSSKKVDVSKIACSPPFASTVPGVHGYNLLRGGSVAAGGPYCEHFRPRKGVRDCSGHKQRHAGDFKMRGKKHCNTLRNGMTYVGTTFTECNCGTNESGIDQCRIAYKHACR